MDTDALREERARKGLRVQRMDTRWCPEKGTLGPEIDCFIHFLFVNSFIKYVLSTYCALSTF